MLTDYILIQLNGKPFNCVPNLFLKDLLVYLGFDLSNVVVEYNNEIVQDKIFDVVKVINGDKIEVLTVVGGG